MATTCHLLNHLLSRSSLLTGPVPEGFLPPARGGEPGRG